MVRYSNNSGETMEDAIVISEVANHSAGVKAEYDYIIQKHGQAPIGWTMKRQSLLQDKGHSYDYLEITLQDGSPKSYYFDITGFFGQIDDVLPPQPSLIKQILLAMRRWLFGR